MRLRECLRQGWISFRYRCRGSGGAWDYGVAPVPDCGGNHSGSGRNPDLYSQYFHPFLALAVLEDSGYMARVAYVMDSVMGKVGLSGKAFLP